MYFIFFQILVVSIFFDSLFFSLTTDSCPITISNSAANVKLQAEDEESKLVILESDEFHHDLHYK